MFKYSPSTGGFYRPDIHMTIPGDAIDVTPAEHAALMAQQTSGLQIEYSGGVLQAVVPVLPIEEKRAGAVLTKDDFADAAVEAGLVSEAEGEAWVKGDALPAAIEAILAAALSGRALRKARWKALSRDDIPRTSPVIATIAASMGLSDVQLDALFGIT